MAETTVVSRLKTELKRSLRSHVAQAVNDVCEAFTEELKPPEPALSEIRPQVGASAFETDYDCCRRLVEYIERNMDTSPGFTQQMECIILAYQSNAPVKVLNSVVKQNLWFRRKCAGDEGAAEQGPSKKTADVHLNGSSQSATSHDEEKSVGEMNFKGGKVVSEVQSAKQEAPRVISPGVQVDSDGANEGRGDRSIDSRKNTLADVNFSKVGDVEAPKNRERASQPAHEKTTPPRVKTSELNERVGLKSTVDSSDGGAVSLPREWGKRKRLVTRRRAKAAVVPSKRARRERPSLDQSSTESDTSQDERPSNQQTTSVARNHNKTKAEPNVYPPATHESPVAVKNQSETGNSVLAPVPASSTSLGTTNEANTNTKQQVGGKKGLVKYMGRPARKAVVKTVNAPVLARARNGSAGGVKSRSDGEEKHDEIEDVEEKSSSIEAELCKVAKDLEAGDEVYGLQVAKVRFQSMLDGLVEPNTDDSGALAAVDPIATLCTIKARSPEQNKEFRTRIRDTIEIVDALLCKPPPGYSCSRDCKSIRAQMCNEYTPCINPVCHAWHDAEKHSESCPNEQCEFKTRVTLRETLHLIDQKQHEITSATDALRRARADLLSPTRRSNQERVSVGNAEAFKRIETLEHDLENLNGELLILLDTKVQQWATLSSIGIDTESDKQGGIPDFASHYTTRSHQRKKP